MEVLYEKCFLGLTGAISATMSFQLATNPPAGGVVQASLSGVALLVSNTISFIASLVVFLVSVYSLDPQHRIPNWQILRRRLSIGLYIAVTSLGLTYLFAASMVTPTYIWPSVGIVIWTSLAVIGVYYIIRSLFTLPAQQALQQAQLAPQAGD